MPTTSSVLYLALLAATLLAATLGLIIVFQAYRGYRRNDSRRMLYLAAGLALITVAPFFLSIVFTVVAPALDSGDLLLSFVLPLASRVLEISGLLLILYSLYRS
ncbi:hypothetical protein B4589_015375 (plasmid) [Halolamina sp. CBA1230]|uniref:DUF7521 family protein n=1 Tax=Haloferacaceae TaxID=1644056 RepID=UPI0009A1BA5B|nr:MULTISPECIES: hypothetical protein [Halorubraceae]OTF01924.1 hypothetical protein B9G49_01380 [Halorubrum sp. SD683]QKY21804.1 hypothetical protein B4589_015375 [Halolamina sp. CBA1230]